MMFDDISLYHTTVSYAIRFIYALTLLPTLILYILYSQRGFSQFLV